MNIQKKTTKLKKILRKYSGSRTGLLTNQSAYSLNSKIGYHFEYFSREYQLKKLLMPEHGLFAELQDQVSGSSLTYNYGKLDVINLYGDSESSLVVKKDLFLDLDLIIIDIRDVGARYYTFLTSAYYLLEKIHEFNKESKKGKISVLIIDSPNPIGRKIEGSPLLKEFESFVGVKGVLHRHGLTPAELLLYYTNKYNFLIHVDICPIGELYSETDSPAQWIPPSPNIPTPYTCLVYGGQCLLEGTNLSEGRGTTKPFEIFGAPFINIQDPLLLSQLQKIKDESYHLRPLYFQPTFHKHSGIRCGGFQLMVLKPDIFHSLRFTLNLLKILKNFYSKDFNFLDGPYEFRSDKKAIELLVGDTFLLQYLDGNVSNRALDDYLHTTENQWKKEIKKLYLYE